MKKIMFLMVFVVLLALPMVSYAETAQECASNCVNKCAPLGSGKEYATCSENCLKGCYDKPSGVPDVPPPRPAKPSSKSEIDRPKLYQTAGLAGKDPKCIGNCGREYKTCLERCNLSKDCNRECNYRPECISECLNGKDWCRTQCDQINSECTAGCN